MKKKGMVQLIVLFLILILLGTAYFLLKKHNQEKQEEKESEETSEIVSVSLNDIKSLSFMISGDEVVFLKDDDSWKMEGRDDFPVKKEQMTILTDALSGVKANRTLEKVESLEDYGLDDPSNVIQVTTTDDQIIKIVVGSSNDATGDCYIYLNNDKETVYTTDGDLATVFSGGLMNYADGEDYPTIVGSNISKVELNQGEHSFVMQSSDSSKSGWSYTDASGNVSDAESSGVSAVQTAISEFTYTNYYEYNSQNAEQYGLDQPYATLKVTYTEAAQDAKEDSEAVEKEFVLYIGNEDGNGNRYVSMEGSGEVHAIAAESLAKVLDGALENAEDLSINNIMLKDIESLRVEYNGITHVFTLKTETVTSEDGEDKSETVYYMDGAEMDTLGFSTFYNHTAAMTAQEMAEEGTTAEGKAEITFTFEKTDGLSLEVRYFPYDSNFYLANRQDGKSYLVNKIKVRNLVNEYQELIG